VITDQFDTASSATIWFEMDNVTASGNDEVESAEHPKGNPHDKQPNPIDIMYVGLWFDMGSHKSG